jgi:hypothetical protein
MDAHSASEKWMLPGAQGMQWHVMENNVFVRQRTEQISKTVSNHSDCGTDPA